MSLKRIVLVVLAVVVSVAVIVVVTAALTPEQTNPANEAAVRFVQAAGMGDDEAAFALLDEAMQAYVRETCRDGLVSACVEAYIPDEWGAFQSVVFRRTAPDGLNDAGRYTAYDVELIATYAEGKGFSGVCIYTRMEAADSGEWRAAGWAGFVSCGDAESRNMADNADAPNRAP